jgi:hypothetical protein
MMIEWKAMTHDIKTHEPNLKLISTYWCNYVATASESSQDQRFFWAWAKVDELVHEISDSALNTLVQLAQSAPDEEAEAYFAAGPLEDYINLIVSKQDKVAAKQLNDNPELQKLLSLVWGEITEFRQLLVRA